MNVYYNIDLGRQNNELLFTTCYTSVGEQSDLIMTPDLHTTLCKDTSISNKVPIEHLRLNVGSMYVEISHQDFKIIVEIQMYAHHKVFSSNLNKWLSTLKDLSTATTVCRQLKV